MKYKMKYKNISGLCKAEIMTCIRVCVPAFVNLIQYWRCKYLHICTYCRRCEHTCTKILKNGRDVKHRWCTWAEVGIWWLVGKKRKKVIKNNRNIKQQRVRKYC